MKDEKSRRPGKGATKRSASVLHLFVACLLLCLSLSSDLCCLTPSFCLAADDDATMTGRPIFDRTARLLDPNADTSAPLPPSNGVYQHPPWPLDGSAANVAPKDLPGAQSQNGAPNSATTIPSADEEIPGSEPPRFFRHPLREPLQPIRPPENLSWLYRPMSVGLFAGALYGSPLMDDWLGQKQGYIGGLRFGWDWDEYWGTEARAAVGSALLYDDPRTIAQQQYLQNNPENFDRYSTRADYDVNVLYYFTGDRRGRPYFLIGAGLVQIRFEDLLLNSYSYTAWGMPLAVGWKYHVDDRMAIRFEVGDEIVFSGGAGFNVLHDLTATAGLEFRFGNHPRTYWPWNPGTRSW